MGLVFFLFWKFYTSKKIIVFGSNVGTQELALLAVCISNSAFDFYFTRDYYFPKLNAEHDRVLRGEDDNTNKTVQLTGPAPGGTGG